MGSVARRWEEASERVKLAPDERAAENASSARSAPSRVGYLRPLAALALCSVLGVAWVLVVHYRRSRHRALSSQGLIKGEVLHAMDLWRDEVSSLAGGEALDSVDEASWESFPASDPPAW